MSSILEKWHSCSQHIRELERQYHRSPNSVQLLAVSKKHSLDKILALNSVGQCDFGENYLAEALPKISATHQKNMTWHFIGRLQSRKIAQIAEHFSWVHSVSRLKEATLLNEYRVEGAPLNVCIQVNVQNTEQKGGIQSEALFELAEAMTKLPNLKLRGLMTLPELETDFSAQRAPYRRLHQLLMALKERDIECDTLSMGTSHDYAAAIAEGATIIRLGQSLFGARD